MRRIFMIAAFATVSGLAATAAAAEDACPKKDGAIQEADLQAAPDCAAAHALHSACAWGSSGDMRLTRVVVEKCEPLFLPRLTQAQKRNYDAQVKHCSDVYAREEGTIAISETALCAEDVAAAFAKDLGSASRARISPPPKAKASFNCEKAQSRLEEIICASDSIGESDINLAKTYRKALRDVSPAFRPTLVASQIGWLKYVAKSCLMHEVEENATRGCVGVAFQVRIDQIEICTGKDEATKTSCLNDYDHPPVRPPQ